MTNTGRILGYLQQAWLVLLLAGAYGGALAGVQMTLAPRIAENRRRETYQTIPQLVPGADRERTVELWISDREGNPARVYRTHDTEGRHNGWVLPATGPGFADDIGLLIGLDASLEKLTGMYVLDQRETPGLGDYIRDADFRRQFQGHAADTPIEAVKSDPQEQQIVVLSGATVSSSSVCRIVNTAIARLRGPLLQAEAEASAAGGDERDQEW